MLLWKFFLVLLSGLSFSVPGLLVIASGFLPVQDNNVQISESRFQEKKFSKSFYLVENSVRNEDYDRTAIPKKIADLTSKFEQEYVQSLIKKREGNFTSQYNFLFWQLGYIPEYFPYYEELVHSARVNEKLGELKEQTARLKSKSPFRQYLSALIEYHLGNYSNAQNILDNIPHSVKETHYLKAMILRGLGDYNAAKNELMRAEKLCGNNKNYLVKIYNSLGSLFFLSGETSKAEDYYKKAYQIAKTTGNSAEQVKSLVNLGIVLDEYGDVYSARESINRALGIVNKIENSELQAFAYSELGVSYSLTNEIIESKKFYELSYQLYRKLNDVERLALLSGNLAALYSQLSNFKAALKFYEEGIKLAGNNKRAVIINLTGTGDVYANLGNYAKALKYYEEAKNLALEIKDINSSSAVDISIGVLLYNIGKPFKAIEYYNKAYETLGDNMSPYLAADLFFKTGLAYTDVDSLQTGAEFYRKGLEYAKSSGDVYNDIIISTEMAHNYYLSGRVKDAEQILIKVKKLSESYDLTQLANIQDLYLAKIYLSNNEKQKALPLLKKVLHSSTSISDYNTQIEAGYLLAQQYTAENNITEAQQYFEQTIALIDELSKPLFGNPEIQIFRFSSLSEVFSAYTEFLYESGNEQKAFEIVERSRSRNTLQNLTNLKITSSIKDEKLLNRLYDIDWMIKSGFYEGTELENITNEFKTLKAEIIKQDPTLEKYVKNIFEHSYQSFGNKLSNEENIVTINVGINSSQLFLHTDKGFFSHRINAGKSEVVKLLREIAPIFSEDNNGEGLYYNQDLFAFNAQASYKLYKILFEPVINKIDEGENIIFNLPYELALLPAEFLVTSYDEAGSPYYYNDKTFLIDKYAISYTPSVSVYFFQKEKIETQNETVLLVGDPLLSRNDFALSYRGGLLEDDSFSSRNIVLFPLQYSRDEVENVNSLINNGYVLTSENATEANFKQSAPQSKIIHLSTHSFLFKEQPLIMFSQNNDSNEDGYLESAEILNLELNSDLVVLSSCKSGLGKIDEAEGILGMQKSFFEAGAKSVMVSLWDVNDKYTSYFMQSFYKYLSDGDDKSTALRKAKIYFKENHSANPYYWAAFVLAGDPYNIKIQQSSGSNLILSLIIIGFLTSAISIIYLRRRKS